MKQWIQRQKPTHSTAVVLSLLVCGISAFGQSGGSDPGATLIGTILTWYVANAKGISILAAAGLFIWAVFSDRWAGKVIAGIAALFFFNAASKFVVWLFPAAASS